MFLLVFAGAKRRSGELSKFLIFDAILGVATFILQKVPESAAASSSFLNVVTITKTSLFKYAENFTTKKMEIFR